MHRIFRCIEGRVERGQSLHKAVTWFAWYYRNRTYRRRPGRKILFTYKTILRRYYRWKADGRTPAAAALKYWSNVKVTMARALKLGRLLLKPKTLTFSAAYRQLRLPRATEAAYRKMFDGRLKGHFAELLAARRRGVRLEARTRRTLARFAARKGRML